MSNKYDNRQPTSDRYKAMIISYNDMIKLMCGEIKITNIPDWTRMVSVDHDFRRRGWIILIEHPSFPKVDPASMPDDFIAEFESTNFNPNEPRKLTFD